MQLSEDALMTVEPEQHGTFIAVGSERGDTTILELSQNLIEPQNNERNVLLAVRTENYYHYYSLCSFYRIKNGICNSA